MQGTGSAQTAKRRGACRARRHRCLGTSFENLTFFTVVGIPVFFLAFLVHTESPAAGSPSSQQLTPHCVSGCAAQTQRPLHRGAESPTTEKPVTDGWASVGQRAREPGQSGRAAGHFWPNKRRGCSCCPSAVRSGTVTSVSLSLSKATWPPSPGLLQCWPTPSLPRRRWPWPDPPPTYTHLYSLPLASRGPIV